MNMNTPAAEGAPSSDLTPLIRKRGVQIVVYILVIAAILFISSGRLDWAMAWVFVGAYVILVGAGALVLIPRQPGLLAERAQIRKDAKKWDKLLIGLINPLYPVMLLLAGLDMRFGLSPRIPLGLQIAAAAVLLLGYGLALWAMAVNKFYSSIVRIQKERGHYVVSSGPYRYVRHPGYVGAITSYALAPPLMLGSLWAFIPAALTVCGTIVRTALEDRTLREELEGYRDYAERVRYRLIPGIW